VLGACALDVIHSGLIHSPRRGADSRLEKRAAIGALEAALLAIPDSHVETPIEHHFSPGLYVRVMRIPAGTVVIGKIHNSENLFVFVSGDLHVETEDGGRRLTDFTVLPTRPGAKRAVVAFADTIVLNVHHNPDDCQDLEELERRYIAPSFEALGANAGPAGQIGEG